METSMMRCTVGSAGGLGQGKLQGAWLTAKGFECGRTTPLLELDSHEFLERASWMRARASDWHFGTVAVTAAVVAGPLEETTFLPVKSGEIVGAPTYCRYVTMQIRPPPCFCECTGIIGLTGECLGCTGMIGVRLF